MNNSDWFGGEEGVVPQESVADEKSCPLPVPDEFTRYEKVQLLRYYINELQNQEGLAADVAYSKALHVGYNEPEVLKQIFCRYINTLYSALRASSIAAAAQESGSESRQQGVRGVGNARVEVKRQSNSIESLLSEMVDSDEK